MKVFDLHCDTLLCSMLDDKIHLGGSSCQVSLEKMKAGNVAAQCFAIYVPTHDSAEEYGLSCTSYEYYRSCLELYKKELDANSDILRPALSASDIRHNLDSGFLSSVLTVEDSVPLEGRIERLDEFYDDGVRMMSLTWNYPNCVGYPNSPDAADHALPLTDFGRQCVERMNELGIIVDVSHLSEGGFFDVAEISKKPFAASHSCARAVCDHRRNLSDIQLRTLADKGGIVGITLVPSFLKEGGGYADCEDVLRHILHIRNIAGIDSIALGSDFDGFSEANQLSSCADYPLLLRLLEKHLPPAEIEKICFENAMRVFKDVCG